jgi:hypothetical protein
MKEPPVHRFCKSQKPSKVWKVGENTKGHLTKWQGHCYKYIGRSDFSQVFSVLGCGDYFKELVSISKLSSGSLSPS